MLVGDDSTISAARDWQTGVLRIEMSARDATLGSCALAAALAFGPRSASCMEVSPLLFRWAGSLQWETEQPTDAIRRSTSDNKCAECTCKAVIDALGGIYGSNVKLLKLAASALDVLGIHPAGLQDRRPLQRISQSFIGTVQAVAELRGTDGTGHGRSQEPVCTQPTPSWSRVSLCHGAAGCSRQPTAWFRTAGAAGASRGDWRQVFHRGDMRALVDELDVERLGDTLQHTVGLAIARRFSVRGTFVPHVDIIEPMARGELVHPEAFTTGVVEGLMLTTTATSVRGQPASPTSATSPRVYQSMLPELVDPMALRHPTCSATSTPRAARSVWRR